MATFSPETLKVLNKAGWREGRNVNTQQWLSLLAERGFSTFPALEAFLKRFGGLDITYPEPGSTIKRPLHFDPTRRTFSSYREEIEAFREIIGVALCPIGEIDAPLLMDETGKVYLTYDGGLYYIGDTGEEAIERICTFSIPSVLVAEVEIPVVRQEK